MSRLPLRKLLEALPYPYVAADAIAEEDELVCLRKSLNKLLALFLMPLGFANGRRRFSS
jgi:hypothetical protein